MIDLKKSDARARYARRKIVAVGLGAFAAAAVPRLGHATPAEVTASILEVFGNGKVRDGRIALIAPKLAETGNSVPITVQVDSPMTEADYVRRIAVFAEQNPRPKIVELFFSPASGLAEVETSIRLSGTQGVVVVAEMSDGSLWRTREQIRVVVGACTALSMRY